MTFAVGSCRPFQLIANELSHILDLASLQNWLDVHCETKRHSGWHHYGPADAQAYESISPRILLVNSESGGYQCCPRQKADEYLKWIEAGFRTPRYGAVLVTAIRSHTTRLLAGEQLLSFSASAFKASYRDAQRLAENMRPTIYMNARITSNSSDNSREQRAEIINEIEEFAPYRKRAVEIFRPEIIICGGRSAKDAIFHERGPFSPQILSTASVFQSSGCIFIMLPHLSRPQNFGGYQRLDAVAREAALLYAALRLVAPSKRTVQTHTSVQHAQASG